MGKSKIRKRSGGGVETERHAAETSRNIYIKRCLLLFSLSAAAQPLLGTCAITSRGVMLSVACNYIKCALILK